MEIEFNKETFKYLYVSVSNGKLVNKKVYYSLEYTNKTSDWIANTPFKGGQWDRLIQLYYSN